LKHTIPEQKYFIKLGIFPVFLSLVLLMVTALNAQNLGDFFTTEDTLRYKNYEITKYYNLEGDFWSATLKKEGKAIATFNKGFKKEWTKFGLFPFLGGNTRQLIIEQYSGGAHCCWSYWIFNLATHFELIYDTQVYPVGYSLIPVYLNSDKVFEFTQGILTFDYFDRLCHALSPIPTVVFKYNKGKNAYVPASQLFATYLLEGIEEDIKVMEEFNETTDFITFDDTGGEYLSAVLQVVLRYVYAGWEKEGWYFYDEKYQLTDKDNMRSKIKKELEKCAIYQYIYDS